MHRCGLESPKIHFRGTKYEVFGLAFLLAVPEVFGACLAGLINIRPLLRLTGAAIRTRHPLGLLGPGGWRLRAATHFWRDPALGR